MKKNRKKMVQCATSAALILSLVLGNSTFVQAEKVSKQESVYVNAEADGTVSQITVSDWLKGSDSVSGTLDDESNLTHITNVKGDETFTQNGSSVEWAAGGKDIYYQGETTQELPVDLKITYKLDGREMSASDMVGKSGKAEIHVSYTNKAKQTKVIDGEETTIYTPFVMVTGMILSLDVFQNIEVDNGRLINDGTNNIVVGLGVPGMAESLGLSGDDAERIPEEFTVTADVTNFSMENTFTFGSPSLLNELDLDEMEDMDDLEDKLDDLTDAAGELVDGSDKLADNMEQFADKMGELKSSVGTFKKDGVDKLAKGIHTLAKGAPDLVKGVNEYTTGVTEFANGTSEYVDGAKQITDGCAELYKKVKDMPGQFKTFGEGLKTYTGSVDMMGTKENVTKLKSGAEAVSEGIATLNTKLDELEKSYELTDQLLQALKASGADAAMLTQLETVLNTQKQGIQMLKAGTAENSDLKQGAAAVSVSVGTVMDSLEQLSANSSALTKAVDQMNASMPQLVQGAKKLQDGGTKLAANNTALKSSSKKLVKASKKLKKSVKTVNKGVKTLDKGGKSLKKASNKLVSGVDKLTDASGKLEDGSRTLSDGASEFNDKGIRKLKDVYDDDIKGMLDRLRTIARVGKDYKCFSGIRNDMDGDVKFVIETAPVGNDKE